MIEWLPSMVAICRPICGLGWRIISQVLQYRAAERTCVKMNAMTAFLSVVYFILFLISLFLKFFFDIILQRLYSTLRENMCPDLKNVTYDKSAAVPLGYTYAAGQRRTVLDCAEHLTVGAGTV
jgi:ABC-type multidrug transport system fused ATPase/permease subunit